MPGVLVGINLFLDGRYYYGNIVGLTDAEGSAELLRSELDLRFAADRAAFPADYRIDLDDCDPVLEVFILPHAEIAGLLGDADARALVDGELLGWYERARNQLVAPTWLRLTAAAPSDSRVLLPLPTWLPTREEGA